MHGSRGRCRTRARVIELGKVASGDEVLGPGRGAQQSVVAGIGAFGGVTAFENWQTNFRGALTVLYGPYPHEKGTLAHVCAR